MLLNGAVSTLSVDHQMQNVSKREGNILKLECEITGNPKPIYNWYKDDELIASANQVKNDKYAHRLRLQDVPFGGKLRIEPALNTDAGLYKCVAENSNGVRETSAHVEIHADPIFRERYFQQRERERLNPPGSKRKSMSARIKSTARQKPVMPSSIIDDSIVNDMIQSFEATHGLGGASSSLGDRIFYSPHRSAVPVDASQQGQCEPYTGSICRNTLHGRPGARVFVSSRSSQDQVERMLQAVISEINSQPGIVGHDCSPFIAPMLCYHHLPPCADQHLDSSAGDANKIEMRYQRSATRYVPMEICQEDCVAVQTRHCRAEYARMWSGSQYGSSSSSSMMLIGSKPLVPDCSSLRRRNQPKSIASDYTGCVRFESEDVQQEVVESRVVPLSLGSAFKQPAVSKSSTSECYAGNGFDYKGKASVTKSGAKCDNWVGSDYAHVVGGHGKHNYCRNPGGDLPAPWCYTDAPFRRELCDIPKCGRAESDISTRFFPSGNSDAKAINPGQSLPTQSPPLTFGSLPVFLPIVAVPILFCLIALVLLCLCRNRLSKCRRQSKKPIGIKMALEQERCNSSSHYYGGFRSSASPGAGLLHPAGLFIQQMCPTTTSHHLQGDFGNTKGIHNSIQMPTYPLAALRFFEQISDSPTSRVLRGEITAAFCESGMPSSIIAKMFRNTEMPASAFNGEVEILASLQHPNVASLIGVCYGPRPWCLLYECMSPDSLRQFLANSMRPSYDPEMMYGDDLAGPNSPFLTSDSSQPGVSTLEHSDLIYIAVQIAAAMEHLTGPQQQLVHRELSSHTIFIGDHLLVKVLPFSASRSGSAGAAVLPPSVIQGSGNGPIASRGRLSSLSATAPNGQDPNNAAAQCSPHCGRVAWLAPETILYGRQSAESDVWSFGIVLWELFSFGCEPYSKASQMPGSDDRRVAELILGHSLLQRPTAASGMISENSADCPEFVYDLMTECWSEIPSRRPSFADIHARLLQWRSEGHFKLRPASSSAVAPSHQSLAIGYEAAAAFAMPPLPRMCSTSQQSSSSTSSKPSGDAVSASTNHTMTSGGTGPAGLNLGDDFENNLSYVSDGGVYCGGNGDHILSQNLLMVNNNNNNNNNKSTASPMLAPINAQHSIATFSTTFGGQFSYQQSGSNGGTGKRRMIVMANEGASGPSASGPRIGQTTAM